MSEDLLVSFVKSVKWNDSGSPLSNVTTGDFLLFSFIVLAIIALATFLFIKKKRHISYITFALSAIVAVGGFSFAFGQSNGFKGVVDPDGTIEFTEASYTNTQSYEVEISSIKFSELEDTSSAIWTINFGDNVIYKDVAEKSKDISISVKPAETIKFQLQSSIDKEIAKKLIDKDVSKLTLNFKDTTKVNLKNVDETSAGNAITVTKDHLLEAPKTATPPPRSSSWELEGWYDASGKAIDFSQPINKDTNIYAHYKDPKVNIQKDYSCTNFMTKGKRGKAQQGMDIYGDLIFSGEDGGNVNIYKFSDGSEGGIVDPIANFDLASSREDNHVNNIEFGHETKAGASFPLLYISNGKVGSEIEFVCYVESITEKNGIFTSELAQEIWLDKNNKETWAAKGYVPIFGAPSWMIDRTQKDCIWVFSAIKRTTPQVTTANWQNEYVATKFKLPKLSDGYKITLTADDILDQVIFPYETGFTQAGCMVDGKIYYCFGVAGNDSTRPARIRVYDTISKTITAGYNLGNDVPIEPEDIFIKDGYMYLNTNTNTAKPEQGEPKIFKISMPKE